MRNHLLHLAAATLLAAGCTASGRMHTSASVSAPELVYIGPNVQVIADYHEPIFYSSNYYWRYDGGVWYRSANYRSGWARIQVVPDAIIRIERPTAYIRYRGTARAAVNSGPGPQPQPQPQYTNDERREIKAEQKEERREEKAEQKEERREDKAERKEDKAERKEDRKDAKEDHKQHKGDHGKKGR